MPAAHPQGGPDLKICCLVKEVPDAAVQKRIDPGTKRLDRSGEKNLNPFDTHGIEAAMQIKEGGKADVEEIVAVTMCPESAVRALHKAVALGADRSVHLTDNALEGSDVCATGYALGKVLEAEQPDLVLLGQQSDDGECYTIGAVVADHLKMPSLTQVIKIEVEDGKLVCERQAEYGYDTVEVDLPAVISVGDAIYEAAKLAGELGTEAAAVVVGDVSDDGAASLGKHGAKRVFRAKSAPEGLAQPIVDVMAKVISDEGFSYALFGGGLLGFEIGAGLTARLNAGVTMEVTAVKVADGKLVAERPVLQASAIVDGGYVWSPGIIISRLNAFSENDASGGDAEVVDVEVELSEWSTR